MRESDSFEVITNGDESHHRHTHTQQNRKKCEPQIKNEKKERSERVLLKSNSLSNCIQFCQDDRDRDSERDRRRAISSE